MKFLRLNSIVFLLLISPLTLFGVTHRWGFIYEKYGAELTAFECVLKDTSFKYYDYLVMPRLVRVNGEFKFNTRQAYITLKNFGNFPVFMRLGRQFVVDENFVVNNAKYGFDGIVAQVFYKYFLTDVYYLKRGEGIYEGNVGAYSVGADKTLYGFQSKAGDFEKKRLLGFHYFKETDEDTDMAKSYLGVSLEAQVELAELAVVGVELSSNYMFGLNRLHNISAPDRKKYRGLGLYSRLYYNFFNNEVPVGLKVAVGYIGRGILNIKSDSYVIEYKPLFYFPKESLFRNVLYNFGGQPSTRGNTFFFDFDMRYRKVGIISKVAFFAEEQNTADVYMGFAVYLSKHFDMKLGFGNYFAEETSFYTTLEMRYIR